MPCLPYSQNKQKFEVSKDTGIIHSEMNTPGIQMAYAGRLFLKMINETGKLGRIAFKPTQAMEDGINAGIITWLLEGTKFKIGRKWAVNAYDEHKESINKIGPDAITLANEEGLGAHARSIYKRLNKN